jgi:hypothetical protein
MPDRTNEINWAPASEATTAPHDDRADDASGRGSRQGEDPRALTSSNEPNPPHEATAGRPDQDQTRTVGAGAGGATEYDGASRNPSRVAGHPPGHSR